jgi:hypothetical protein
MSDNNNRHSVQLVDEEKSRLWMALGEKEKFWIQNNDVMYYHHSYGFLKTVFD